MSSSDLVLVQFDGELFDIKKFLGNHPGGIDTLKNYQGKSVKEAMKKFGHSISAYSILRDLKVGNLLKKGYDFDDDYLTDEVSENGRIITREENSRDLDEIKFLEELEGRLDWSKPLLNQIEAIVPHYDKWVYAAVYKECRLFASPVMESITSSPWYMVPIVWLPVILYLGISQYLELVVCKDTCQKPLTYWQFMYHFILGVFIWTTLEYSTHRWVYHFSPGSSVTMMKIHFLVHGVHHKVPFDNYRQVFPPVPAFFSAVIVYIMLRSVTTYPLLTLAGLLTGYLSYDMMHYYAHHGSPKAGSYLYTMRRYHSSHHFSDSSRGFGVSSKLWDYVFNTIVYVKRLGFSLHW